MKPTARRCKAWLLTALLLAGCDRATTLEFGEAEQPRPTCTIARLKSRCEGASYPITDQTVIRGIVTGNNRYGEFYNQLVIEDASGGLAIAAEYDASDNAYPLGEELVVYCNGLTLYDYGGKIELGKAVDGNLCIPRDEADKHLRLSGLPAARITARPVRIGKLTPADADTYVRIDDVRFAQRAAWCDFDPETGRYVTTERTLADADGNTLAVRTLGGCLYAGEPLPEGNGSLCGIIGYFNGSFSLCITGIETSFVTPPATPATAYP